MFTNPRVVLNRVDNRIQHILADMELGLQQGAVSMTPIQKLYRKDYP